MVNMLVESENGHDTVDVPKEKVEEQVKEELKKDSWVTLEKENGKTEVLTKKDLPDDLDEEDKKLQEQMKSAKDKKADWKKSFAPKTTFPKSTTSSTNKNFSKKFEKVRSVTSTKTVKGG